MTAIPSQPSQRSNGRRAAIAIIVVAFLASAITLVLALTASHSARQRDAAALAADSHDLHSLVNNWHMQLSAMGPATAPVSDAQAIELRRHADLTSAWKPRTPCGQEARDRLKAAMDTRITSLSRGTPGTVQDEQAVVDDALKVCQATSGQDVNI